MADQDPDNPDYDSLLFYLGLARGALAERGAREYLAKSLKFGNLKREYIEGLRDMLSDALKDYP